MTRKPTFFTTVKRAGVQSLGFLSLGRMFFLVYVVSAWLPTVLPLNTAEARGSSRELKNFHHTTWSSDILGAVDDIQQSPDGYLWLTTSKGVFRFDGVRFQSADEITGGATKNIEFASAFVSSSGDVWFRTRLPGLMLWRDGTLSKFPIKGCTPGLLTGSTVEDRDGRIWVAGSAGLFIVAEGKCERVGDKYGLPVGFPSAMAVDAAGTLWVQMYSGTLLYLPRGAIRFNVKPFHDGEVGDFAYLHEGPDGSMWLSDAQGLRRVSGDSSDYRRTSGTIGKLSKHSRFGNFTFDRDGTLWAASGKGIERIPGARGLPTEVRVDSADGQDFTIAQGLNSDVVWKIFVDREGNLWVGTNSGLDQLRRNLISQQPIPAANEDEIAIAAGNNGAVWIGSRSLPLTEVRSDGAIRTHTKTGSSYSIRRDFKGNIWSSGFGKHKLWRSSGDQVEQVEYPPGVARNAISTVLDKDNNLWLLTFNSDVFRRVGQRWENEDKILGREPGISGSMETDPAGNVWFSFSNHVIEWDGSGYRRYNYTGKNRYPTCLMVKGAHVWLGAEDGVQLMTKGEFHMIHWKDPSSPGRVTGIVETKTGDLWVSGFSGVTHVRADEMAHWLRDPNYAVSSENFNTLDGLPGLAAERFPEPSIAETDDGHLWFATTKGIAWLDPASLDHAYNSPPPTVLVTSLVVDGKPYSGASEVALPPRLGSLEIDYTALSLAIPERVLFRYKLDGVDSGWQSAGTRRQAYYTKLSPGTYRFRVIACNDHGVWNNVGANVNFTIAPAWFQTNWFYTLCAATVCVILWVLYRLRIHRLALQFNMRLEERVGERTRIARDLHDTLLQSFHGLLLRLQAAYSLLPERPDEAKQTLGSAIDQAAQAATEGREAVQDLRSSTVETNDLAVAIRAIGEELSAEGTNHNAAVFHVEVEGKSRNLHPILRDEVYRIAAEALRNAFRHAQARRIEVELRYDETQFRLRIRDDGKGIDPKVLGGDGRTGHYGLPGMRERAGLVGGKLTVWSELDSGTELELTIPASTGYATSPRRSWLSKTSFRKGTDGTGTDSKETDVKGTKPN
jgi:signal transduction histidine kinase/ligand-binding sensor domain-containing protein